MDHENATVTVSGNTRPRNDSPPPPYQTPDGQMLPADTSQVLAGARSTVNRRPAVP